MPPIFELTKNNRIDVFLGDLSYPLYLVHLMVIQILLIYAQVYGGLLRDLVRVGTPYVALSQSRLPRELSGWSSGQSIAVVRSGSVRTANPRLGRRVHAPPRSLCETRPEGGHQEPLKMISPSRRLPSRTRK